MDAIHYVTCELDELINAIREQGGGFVKTLPLSAETVKALDQGWLTVMRLDQDLWVFCKEDMREKVQKSLNDARMDLD